MPTLAPVDFDPFADPTPAPTAAPVGAQPATGAPAPGIRFATPADAQPSASPRLVPVDHDPFAPPDVATDVAKSTGIGLVKGTTGMIGAPGAAVDLIGNSAEYLMERGANAVGLLPYQPRSYSAIAAQNKALSDPIMARSDDMNAAIERHAGPLYTPQTTPGRYAETAAEFVPGALAMPGSPAANIVKSAIVPGVASEAAGDATAGTGYETAARIGASLAAPTTLAAGRKLVTPLPISSERAGQVDLLRNEGVPLTAGQVTGSKALRYGEDALSSIPGAGGGAAMVDEAQKAAYTAAALRRLGISSESAAPEVLASAKKALGQKFDDLASRNMVNFDHAFAQDLAQVQSDYQGLTLPNQQAPIVQKTLDSLMNTDGSMAGTKYQAVRSNLDKAGRSLAQSNPPLSQALFGIRNALDGAMTRSVTGEDAAAWADVRNKWRNWKVIEKASTMAGENAAQGNISPQALRSATAGQNRGAYAVGQGDYADLARAGTAIMSPLPNSGTAQRGYMMHLLSTLGAGAGGLNAGPGGFALGAMLPIATPMIAGRALMSRPIQAYLGNQRLAGGSRPSALQHLLLAAPPTTDALSANRR